MSITSFHRLRAHRSSLTRLRVRSDRHIAAAFPCDPSDEHTVAQEPRVFNFTPKKMAPYYLPPVVVRLLGVAAITIKRNWKRRGIKWPYCAEKLKKIQEVRADAVLSQCHEHQWDAP